MYPVLPLLPGLCRTPGRSGKQVQRGDATVAISGDFASIRAMTLDRNSIEARAVRNNAQWCDLVCRAHGGHTVFHEEVWINREPSPRFYPNAVTLTDSTVRQLELVDELIVKPFAKEWALKDSFASLDLAGRGFTMLFEAQWIHLPASHSIQPPGASTLRWEPVRSESALADWESAWNKAGGGEPESPRIFLASLMRIPDVVFVAGYREERVVAGAIANRSDGVVGWSNWFASAEENPRECAAGSLAAIRVAFPDLPAVGYETGDALQIALSLGFESLAPLRVWLFTRLQRGAADPAAGG